MSDKKWNIFKKADATSVSASSQQSDSKDNNKEPKKDSVFKQHPKAFKIGVAVVAAALVICCISLASCSHEKPETAAKPTASATASVEPELAKNAQDVTLLDSDGKETKNKITVATVKKADATPSALTDWYYEHVVTGNYKYGILKYSDEAGKGIYADSTGIYESDLKADDTTKGYTKPADTDKVYTLNPGSKTIRAVAKASASAETTAEATATPEASESNNSGSETASNSGSSNSGSQSQQSQKSNGGSQSSRGGSSQSSQSGSSGSSSGNTSNTAKQTCRVVHHDAVTHEEPVYQTVHHDAVTHVVHHDAVTHGAYECAACHQQFSDKDYGSRAAALSELLHHITTSHPGASYSVVSITDSPAYDETIVDQDAYDETVQTGTQTVIDQAAYDETVCG